MSRVTGKIALVTGGASGIGSATAKLLAREGATVIIADRDAARGAEVAAEIGASATYLPLDVTRADDWDRVMAETTRRFGRLDVLVSSAGVAILKDIESVTLEEWRFVHAVNVEGVFLGAQRAVRVMKESGGGSIVNLSSIAGIVGTADDAAYCSSKGAVRLLTKSIALHCAHKGYAIRCNSVHPSFIQTPMVAGVVAGAAEPEKMRRMMERASPLGRLGEPDDVAYMILYLASDESKFVTGAELVVDGGTTAR